MNEEKLPSRASFRGGQSKQGSSLLKSGTKKEPLMAGMQRRGSKVQQMNEDLEKSIENGY
jgi:hypothetical protein